MLQRKFNLPGRQRLAGSKVCETSGLCILSETQLGVLWRRNNKYTVVSQGQQIIINRIREKHARAIFIYTMYIKEREKLVHVRHVKQRNRRVRSGKKKINLITHSALWAQVFDYILETGKQHEGMRSKDREIGSANKCIHIFFQTQVSAQKKK